MGLESNIIKEENPVTNTYGKRKSGLTQNDLVLLGKGQYKRMKPIACAPYKGDAGGIWDPEQSVKNREAGFWSH